jgi:hypothetical protein
MESEDLEIEVRALMERQHKSMVARLKKGEFDTVIAERLDGQPPQAAAPPPAPAALPAPAAPAASASPSAAASSASRDAARAFGEGIVSQKPLDEVILDYLVDKARVRPDRTPRRPRKKP